MVDKRQDAWDRFWKNKQGEVVVYQHPNIPLLIWLVLTIASLFTQNTVSNILWYLALAALTVWSLLELFKGVNYLRRVLGAVVLIMVIIAIFKLA